MTNFQAKGNLNLQRLHQLPDRRLSLISPENFLRWAQAKPGKGEWKTKNRVCFQSLRHPESLSAEY